VRALPYDAMKAGLASNDLSGDSNITGSGCGSSACFGGEQIALHAPDPANDAPPLVPHISNPAITVGPTSYNVSTYVTYYCPGCVDPTTSDARRVTTYVTWNSRLKGNTSRSVQVQTVIYSSACPPLTHKYLGPCVPSFNAVAERAPALATISGTINGVGLDHATLTSGRASSDGAIEQIWRVHGTVQAAGASIQATGGSEQSIGGATASSSADSDNGPNSPPVYDSHTLAAPATAPASASFGATSLSVSTTVGDSGVTTSTTSACTTTSVCTSPSTPTPRLCPNVAPYETDLLACGGSSVTSAAATAQATFGALGATNLASISSQANTTVATVDRKLLTSGTNCLATVGGAVSDGCLQSQMSRSGATLSAGALPASLGSLFSFASNGGYFVKISGLTDSATAQAGVSSTAPTVSQSGLQITYLTSVLGIPTLVTKVLSDLVGGLTLPSLDVIGTGAGLGTTVSISMTVTPASTACTSNGVASSCSTSSTATRTAATAVSTPPIVTVTYNITGAVTSSLSIVLDPGVLSASTSYVPAQS
jgi:hypothetical protein